ncbi:hypothetical protein EOW77_0026085 [Bradyrhizobium yuanmingense]|nr:hypothetical protein EOW77_0026085 [Bradyrhizobium yuanmingense]
MGIDRCRNRIGRGMPGQRAAAVREGRRNPDGWSGGPSMVHTVIATRAEVMRVQRMSRFRIRPIHRCKPRGQGPRQRSCTAKSGGSMRPFTGRKRPMLSRTNALRTH